MKYLNKIIEYGLYFLAFLLPLQTRWIIKAGETEYTTYGLYGTDIVLILVLLLFLFVIASSPESSSGLKGLLAMTIRDKLKIKNLLIFGLLAMSFISVFLAANRLLALYKLGWLILGLGLFWLVVSANYNRVKLIYAMLAGIFFQAILGIWQFLTQSSLANKWLGLALHKAADLGASVIETVGADGVGERWLRAYGGLDHPNILGGMIAIGALLLVGEIIKFGKFSIFNWLLFIIFGAALFFSFSRSAWLALLIGLAVMLALALWHKNLEAQKNILQAVLISGLVFFVLFFQFSNLVLTRLYASERLEVKSMNERFVSLKNSWPIIKSNWAAGVGLGNYTLALSRQEIGQESFYYQPAHDVYLVALSEMGIFGFIFFLSVIVFSSMRLLRRPDYGAPRNDSGAAVLTALIIIMSFDHWLWSLHFGVLFFWLVLGLIFGDKKIDKYLIR